MVRRGLSYGRQGTLGFFSLLASGLPHAIAGCAFLGYRFPERPWRWPLVLFEAQFLGMCLRNGELGNLWPMGLALFAVISIPGILGAKLAAHFRERVRREAA